MPNTSNKTEEILRRLAKSMKMTESEKADFEKKLVQKSVDSLNKEISKKK